MKIYVKGKSVKIEQAGVVFYDIDWEGEIEKYEMKLRGSFAMPTKKGGKSIMTSINEHIRIVAQDYLKKYPLYLEGEIQINHDQLHGAVMKILGDAIDSVSAAGEPLFEIAIDMKKSTERELENENLALDKKIEMLKFKIDAKKEVMKEMEAMLEGYDRPMRTASAVTDNRVEDINTSNKFAGADKPIKPAATVKQPKKVKPINLGNGMSFTSKPIS